MTPFFNGDASSAASVRPMWHQVISISALEADVSLPKLCRVGFTFAIMGAVVASAAGQLANSSVGSGTSSTAPAAVTHTVSGRVINAVTGAAVPRSLVNLNSRIMLTDTQGRFSFTDFTETQGYLLVQKPGFSQNADSGFGMMQQRLANLDAVQDVKLYPDAVVAGTVIGSDGLGLSHIQIRLRRLIFDTSGARWIPVGFTQTDTRGQYRLSQPAGRYRLSTEFDQRNQDTGEAVLPVAFPSLSGGNHGEYFELRSGETQEINLRPKTGMTSPFTIKIDLQDGQRGIRLGATGSSGVTFRLPTQGRSGTGEYKLDLPIGSYTIRAILEDRDDAQSGVARLTVTGKGVPEVPLQLSPASVFPVEMVFQASGTGLRPGAAVATTPNARSFNLWLQNRASDGDGEDPDAQFSGRGDASPQLRVLPGRYRLMGGRSGAWTVTSATCGPTDLLRDDLVVGPGAAGSPIRVILSNASGRLHGTVTEAGTPATGWLYLVPAEPTLTPEIEIFLQTDGTYRWTGAPGKYTAVVSDHQMHDDFRDPKFLARFSAGGRAVEVTEGGDTAADLTMGAPAP